ncbi:hypothetical protein [Sphingomonas sp. 1P08PE]|uniref:hypothetical protein n=1 Tax=Sphingomonas sp. 1P08PE TaxID=554122 RepID=UPI0039A22901
MRYRDLAGYMLAASLPMTAAAQEAAPPAADSPRVEKARLDDRSEALKAEQDKIAERLKTLAPDEDEPAPGGQDSDGPGSFAGLKLGVGLSLTIDIGDRDRVSEAQLVDRTVRVTDQDNGRARIMLESHYFFKPGSRDDRGIGPFIAIQPGSGEIIDAIGAGLMFGFRREKSTQSFNIGVGLVFDPNTRILGDGFVANQPAPDGETEVRYRETLQTGVLLLTSFSF